MSNELSNKTVTYLLGEISGMLENMQNSLHAEIAETRDSLQSSLRAEIAETRDSLQNSLRAEIAETRDSLQSSLRTEIAETREALHAEIADPDKQPFCNFLRSLFIVVHQAFPPLKILAFLCCIILLRNRIKNETANITSAIAVALE